MEITRDVILDLMPLYLADELSADSRALVERFLDTDPELADIARQSTAMAQADDIPTTLTMEDKMKAYLQAKRLMFWRTVILAVLISFTLFGLLSLALLAWRLVGS
jgi:anti-sigma factor RsiW